MSIRTLPSKSAKLMGMNMVCFWVLSSVRRVAFDEKAVSSPKSFSMAAFSPAAWPGFIIWAMAEPGPANTPASNTAMRDIFFIKSISPGNIAIPLLFTSPFSFPGVDAGLFSGTCSWVHFFKECGSCPRGALVCFLLFWTFPLLAQKVPVTEKELPNGMRLLLVERHDDPTIAGGWVAHVGSANERPGITGIAHLFEHMMFKGTPTVGTKDYKKDIEIIGEQEKVREEMRQEESRMRQDYRQGKIDDLLKPENKTPRLKELEKKFNDLITKQRDILVKNDFDKIYTTAGASGMNAFTTSDLTGYYITVPANKLELWMWMESERLLHPVFREFYAERDVVFEERRMRTDSTPLGKFGELFESMVWESHPYHWPTVGWPSDIPAITKAQADEFYSLYYAPQNITLILAGDFKAADAMKLATSYFGRIPRGKAQAPDVVTLEVKQTAEKRM